MPLTSKGKKIMRNMKAQYGSDKGERVFYASRNKGTITGVDPESSHKKKEKSAAYMQGFKDTLVAWFPTIGQ